MVLLARLKLTETRLGQYEEDGDHMQKLCVLYIYIMHTRSNIDATDTT